MRRWSALIAVIAILSALLVLVGAPIAFMLGGLLASLGFALVGRAPTMAAPWFAVAQMLIGVSVGVSLSGSVLATLRDHGLLIGAMVILTLGLSLLAGQILRIGRRVSPVTAVFASVAGGASGVVGVAREAGADEAVVATVQYMRVVVVVLAMPLAVIALGGVAATASRSQWAELREGIAVNSAVFVALALVITGVVASIASFPGNLIVISMTVSVLLTLSGWFGTVEMPQPLLVFAFAVLGAQVGLRFTTDALRAIARILPLVVVQIAVTVAACAGVAVGVAAIAHLPLLDVYLASTPGGVFAVAAVAVSSDANVGVIFATQVLRTFAALALVPLLARAGRNRSG